MSENFSFDFLGVSRSSSRGLTDEPVAPPVQVEGELSVPEMLDVLFGVMMERFDVVEKRLDDLEKRFG